MKAVYIATGFVLLGLGTWVAIILINGVRKRIETVNTRRRKRAEREGNRHGY